MHPQRDIKSVFPEELQKILYEEGFKKYRSAQVLSWVWSKRCLSFDDMKNIPASLRSYLEKAFTLRSGALKGEAASADGTKKYLINFPSDAYIETVFIPSEKRNTLCVSTQAGCPAGCVFCATGKAGLHRDLDAGEILEQVLIAEEKTGEKVDNIVIMGMGEPFLNYDNVIRAVRIMTAPYALKIGARRITLSTVGIPEKIRKLAEEKDITVRLSVSLHAPDNILRSRLIPMNKKYPVEDIIKASRYYTEKAKKYVTFEYLLLKGINDSDDHAKKLAGLLKGWKAKVNLIPFNSIGDSAFSKPSEERVSSFARTLSRGGVSTTIRKERGMDIQAACGQLGLQYKRVVSEVCADRTIIKR